MYNYLCNQCLSPLMLWVQISIRARCTTSWFSRGSPDSSSNETDHHDITEIVLKVALNTIKQTKFQKRIMSTKVDINILLGVFYNLKIMFSCLYYLFSTKWHSNLWVMVRVIVFNATFNNILTISWRSVLLVEQTEVRGKKHWPVESHRQTLSHNVVPSGTHDYIYYYY